MHCINLMMEGLSDGPHEYANASWCYHLYLAITSGREIDISDPTFVSVCNVITYIFADFRGWAVKVGSHKRLERVGEDIGNILSYITVRMHDVYILGLAEL